DRRCPGDVVDAAGTLQRALLRRVVVEVEAAALRAASFPAASPLLGRLELERLEQGFAGLWRRRVGADALEALERELGRDFGMVGDQRLVLDVDDQQLVAESLGVLEVDARRGLAPLDRDPLAAEALLPEVERLLRSDSPDDRVDFAGAGAAPRNAREL